MVLAGEGFRAHHTSGGVVAVRGAPILRDPLAPLRNFRTFRAVLASEHHTTSLRPMQFPDLSYTNVYGTQAGKS